MPPSSTRMRFTIPRSRRWLLASVQRASARAGHVCSYTSSCTLLLISGLHIPSFRLSACRLGPEKFSSLPRWLHPSGHTEGENGQLSP
jgi:hypothetical protein